MTPHPKQGLTDPPALDIIQVYFTKQKRYGEAVALVGYVFLYPKEVNLTPGAYGPGGMQTDQWYPGHGVGLHFAFLSKEKIRHNSRERMCL